MIPGKRYGFDDYLGMVWRRKWLIAVSLVVVNVTTAVVASRLVPPKVYEIHSIGLFGGLLAGLALVAFLEVRDTTFRSDDDVASSLSLPVLAVIPAMLTTRERLQRRRRRLAVSLTAITAISAAGAAVAWVIFS